MELTVLGTQSPYSLPDHHCPGFLVRHGDAKLMLDCGSGTHSALSMPDDLNGLGIVISHMHLDHCSDIGSIQYASYVFHEHGRLSAPVDIWVPRRPEARNVVVNEPIAYATYHGIDEGTAFDFHGLHVDFCRTDHFMECYATRVSDGRATVVYTGDLAFSCHGRIAEFSHGADLLVCESSLLDSYGLPESKGHLTAKQAATIAREAGVKRLLLTHFWPEEDTERYADEARPVFGNVSIASEGMTVIV